MFKAFIVVVCVCVSLSLGSEPDEAGAVEDSRVRVYTDTGVVEGQVQEVTADGVSVQIQNTDDNDTVVLPWYEVRWGEGVEGDWVVPDEFEERMRLAVLGYERRRRGDLTGCGEMYARIAVELVGSRSKLAVEVFGGLLEDAIVRDDYFDAAVAMMALHTVPMAAQRSGVDGFDARYRVFEAVPLIPGGEGSHRLMEVAALLTEEDSSGGAVVRAFGIVDGDGDVEGVLEELNHQRGVDREFRQTLELYSQMLSAQKHPDLDERNDARRWLRSRSESMSGTWIDAWCRLALGVSYLNETTRSGSNEMLSRGVVQLVHVNVRLGEDYPGLARRAQELAVDGLQRGGRYEEASELMSGDESRVLGTE